MKKLNIISHLPDLSGTFWSKHGCFMIALHLYYPNKLQLDDCDYFSTMIDGYGFSVSFGLSCYSSGNLKLRVGKIDFWREIHGHHRATDRTSLVSYRK